MALTFSLENAVGPCFRGRCVQRAGVVSTKVFFIADMFWAQDNDCRRYDLVSMHFFSIMM